MSSMPEPSKLKTSEPVCECLSEPSHHKVDHGDFDPSLARAWTDLVVPSEATVVAQPCEGSLHDPTPWQNGTANLSLWLANDIEHKLSRLLRPFDKSTGVYSIRPHPRQPGKAVLQPSEHQLAAIAVLHIGAGDRYGQDQTQYIDHDMPLTTLGALRSIVAPIAPFCCVATLWLSTIAALGQICRPLLARA